MQVVNLAPLRAKGSFVIGGRIAKSIEVNCMSSELEVIFGELGLAQYLSVFVEQGFDEWDIILDIQESDL